MTSTPRKGKGAGRKAGYEAYKKSNRSATNKLKKVARHQLKHPNDKQAVGTVPSYKSKKIGLNYTVEGVTYVFNNGWKELKKGAK